MIEENRVSCLVMRETPLSQVQIPLHCFRDARVINQELFRRKYTCTWHSDWLTRISRNYHFSVRNTNQRRAANYNTIPCSLHKSHQQSRKREFPFYLQKHSNLRIQERMRSSTCVVPGGAA